MTAKQYLLDTNTVSYIIKGTVPAIRGHLRAVPMAGLAVSAVTEAELRYGAARIPEAKRLEAIVAELLLRLTVLPWDSGAALEYGRLRAAGEKEGRPIGNLDLMIAAHALATDRVLVSSDRAFREIRRLKVEDWTKP